MDIVLPFGFNGLFKVASVINTTSFTYTAIPSVPDVITAGNVHTKVRITSIDDIDAVVEQYTKQPVNDLWGFVVPEDVLASKDRSLNSDATASIVAGDDSRTRFIDPFSFYVFIPTSTSTGRQNNIGALEALDIARDTLILPLLRTLFGLKLPTPVTEQNKFQVNFVGHGQFPTNRAYYAHQYRFESVYDITDCDKVEPFDSRAFRDIDGELLYDIPMEFDINLDQES
jgi:hypothetical protein